MRIRRALPLAVVLFALSSVSVSAQPPRSPGGPRGPGAAPSSRTTSARRTRPSRRPPPPPELVLAIEADPARPFHVRVRLDVGTEPLAEALADLRVLGFEVTAPNAGPRARPLRCAWPTVPARNDAEKVVATPAPGSALIDDYVDVRMFCVGAAYEALVRGGSLRPVYGYARASRQRYVARAARRSARPVAQVAGEARVLRSPPPSSDLPIRVSMPTADTTRGGTVVVRPYVEGTARGARAYVRDDLWSFDLRAPSGRTARCVVPRHPITPIRDFFTRMSAGRRTAFSIDLGRLCPGFVEEPGIYDIVPIIEFVYDGSNVGIEALTGRFRGGASFIRVRPSASVLPSELVRPEAPPASPAPATGASQTAPAPPAAQ